MSPRAHTRGCLGDETIAAVLEGGLPDHAARQARDHLAECDDCRRLVSASVEAGVANHPSMTVETAGANTLASAAPAPLPDAVFPGAVIAGRFRIERLIGEGGMGRVFAAHHLDLDRPVALKIIRRELAHDDAAVRRFMREARVVASLMSEHVVRILDLNRFASGEPFLVMELLSGRDLGAALRMAHGPLPVPEALTWIRAACDALAEAHALGIVHRDIKPQNLFLAAAAGGAHTTLKVLDFGLAKLVTHPGATSITVGGQLLGSPLYMAPEQVLGQRVDARADVWALGVTTYHLLAGAPPFTGHTLSAILDGILGSNAPPLVARRSDVPPELANIIHRCVAKDPAARFADARELSRALSRALSGQVDASAAQTFSSEGPLAAGAAPAARSSAPFPMLDARFELLDVLGKGGHGVVYRAVAKPHGRPVAIKVLHTDALDNATMRERFLREAKILQRLEHPNVVRLFELGFTADSEPFVVMELVRGRTLASEIKSGALAPARVARIATQALRALVEAHALGIVHRDVKPANLMLTEHAGDPDFVMLLDFGLAREDDHSKSLTQTGQLLGTPRYMAPEQLLGVPVDGRCDLYALGLVLAEALRGRPVYEGSSVMQLVAAAMSAAPTPLGPEVLASPLGPIIARATQKSPAARFTSAKEMLELVERAGESGRSVVPFAEAATTAATAPMHAPIQLTPQVPAPARSGPLPSVLPLARPSPAGPSPAGPSPVGPSPVGPSPVGPSPVGPSPVGPPPASPSGGLGVALAGAGVALAIVAVVAIVLVVGGVVLIGVWWSGRASERASSGASDAAPVEAGSPSPRSSVPAPPAQAAKAKLTPAELAPIADGQSRQLEVRMPAPAASIDPSATIAWATEIARSWRSDAMLQEVITNTVKAEGVVDTTPQGEGSVAYSFLSPSEMARYEEQVKKAATKVPYRLTIDVGPRGVSATVEYDAVAWWIVNQKKKDAKTPFAMWGLAPPSFRSCSLAVALKNARAGGLPERPMYRAALFGHSSPISWRVEITDGPRTYRWVDAATCLVRD